MKSINSGTRRAPGQISFIFHAVFGKNFGKKGGRPNSLELAPFLRNPGSATVSIISMKLKQLKLGKNGLISPPCNHMSQNVLSLGCD